MATSSKTRRKASSSHTAASPRTARRARSSSRPLPEKDHRDAKGKSRQSERYAGNGSKAVSSRYTDSHPARPRRARDSDEAESTRSQLKKQKAQLRAQSPDEDLYQTSSSESSSSSDAVQVVITARRYTAATSSKSRDQPSKAKSSSSSKSVVDRPKARPSLQPTRPSPKARRLESDSVSPPPLRASSSSRSKARPSAPLKPATSERQRLEKTRESPDRRSTASQNVHRSPHEQHRARPALQAPKREVVAPIPDDTSSSDDDNPVLLAALSKRQTPASRSSGRPSVEVPLKRQAQSPRKPTTAASRPVLQAVSRNTKSGPTSDTDSSEAEPRRVHSAHPRVKPRVEHKSIAGSQSPAIPRRSALQSPTRTMTAVQGSETDSESSAAEPPLRPNPKKSVPSAVSPVRPTAVSVQKRRAPSPSDSDSSAVSPPHKKAATGYTDRLPPAGVGASAQKSRTRAPTPTDSESDLPAYTTSDRNFTAKSAPSASSHIALPHALPVDRASASSDSEEDESAILPVRNGTADVTLLVEETVEAKLIIREEAAIPAPLSKYGRVERRYSIPSPRRDTSVHRVTASPSPKRQTERSAEVQVRSAKSAQDYFVPGSREEDFSSVDDPDSYVGTSGHNYMERMHARQANGHASSSPPKKEVATSQHYPETEELVKDYKAQSFSPEPSPPNEVPAPLMDTEQDDEARSSRPKETSLKARKSTASALLRESYLEAGAESPAALIAKSKSRIFSASPANKPFPRFSRSSSDEEDSVGEENANLTTSSMPQRATSPFAIQDYPSLDEEAAMEPLSPEGIPPARTLAHRSLSPVTNANLEPLPLTGEMDGANDSVDASHDTVAGVEDIPVPSYRSPSRSNSPQTHRDEEPRFTATSRIISQPARSKSKTKKQRRHYEDDMDIPVPYDEDEQAFDASDEERSAEEELRQRPAQQKVKQERISLSKRARKVTGGISASAAREYEPVQRPRTRTRRSVKDDQSEEASDSQSDTFGDNGAIVSDSTEQSGHSDSRSLRLASRNQTSASPDRTQAPRAKRAGRTDADFVNDMMLRKRRTASSTKPEVVIRPSAPRRSSSVAVANKPTRPSKAARSSNARHLFEANGAPRRKSLNERFSGEDTESSDNVEVMKSSTLQEGQSADAVLRVLSRETREREERSASEHAERASRLDKGKQRQTYETEPLHEEDSRLLLQGAADSDDSLPPPLREYESLRPSNGTRPSSRDRVTHSKTRTDARLSPRPRMLDPDYEERLFSSPPIADKEGYVDFFGDEAGSPQHPTQEGRSTAATRASGDQPTPRRSPQARDVGPEDVHEKSPQPNTATAASQQAAATLHDTMPQEVRDAVLSAASDAYDNAREPRKRKTGPTPVNGRRRRSEEEAQLEEEDDDVVVQDSAIVKDPHGRMMRKEEMLRLLAEYQRPPGTNVRSSSLEDAEGSVVDEAELAIHVALADEDRFQASRNQLVDVDATAHSEIGEPSDLDADDQGFNVSIARFEVHVEELHDDLESLQVEESALQGIEGIVEEYGEDFWEDETEIFVIEQILQRHYRRKSGRLSKVQDELRSSHAPYDSSLPFEVRHGEGLETASPKASASDNVRHSPLDGSTSDRHPITQTLRGEEHLRTSSSDRPEEEQASDAMLAPSSPAAVMLSSVTSSVLQTELSPELAVPDTPRRLLPQAIPSKPSPRKHFEKQDPLKQINRLPRPESVLQTRVGEDDEEMVADDQPTVAPSMRVPAEAITGVPAEKAPLRPSASPPSPALRHERSPAAQTLHQQIEQPLVNHLNSSHRQPRTPPPEHLARSPVATPSTESRRSRRSSNVYVEIQSSPKKSPLRKKAENGSTVPHAQPPSSPISAPVLASKSVDAASAQDDISRDEGAESSTDASNSAGLAPGVTAEENVQRLAKSLSPQRDSSYVDEINAMVDKELAGMADVLQDAATTESEGRLVASDEMGEDVHSQIAASSAYVETDIAMSTEEIPGTSIMDTPLVEAEGEVVVVEVVTTTTTEICETTEINDIHAPNLEESSQARTTDATSGSDSEPPSEHGVRVPSPAALPIESLGPSMASTSEDATSRTSVSSTSSADDSEANEESEESDDAEGEDLPDDPDTPFRLTELLAWADSLKDTERPHIITSLGAKRLFDQMRLSTEGALPLLLAWKLESPTKAECVKADFISLLRHNEIDSPSKLSAYLTATRSTTLAIPSHVRFPSASVDETDNQPVRSWHVPEVYRSFYEFSFDYARDAPHADTISKDQARNLWWIILAPCLSRGQDIVDYLDSGEWNDEISKEAWLAMLDAVTSADLLTGNQDTEVTENRNDLVSSFRRWLANRASLGTGEPAAMST